MCFVASPTSWSFLWSSEVCFLMGHVWHGRLFLWIQVQVQDKPVAIKVLPVMLVKWQRFYPRFFRKILNSTLFPVKVLLCSQLPGWYLVFGSHSHRGSRSTHRFVGAVGQRLELPQVPHPHRSQCPAGWMPSLLREGSCLLQLLAAPVLTSITSP